MQENGVRIGHVELDQAKGVIGPGLLHHADLAAFAVPPCLVPLGLGSRRIGKQARPQPLAHHD